MTYLTYGLHIQLFPKWCLKLIGSGAFSSHTGTTPCTLFSPLFLELPSRNGSDLMLHLPARHNLRVLRNIQASGARFLMASTFVEADENQASDTFVPPVGHSINLSLPPYCLPEPIALVKDHSSDRSDLRMGLWELTSEESLPLGGNCSKIVRLEQRP